MDITTLTAAIETRISRRKYMEMPLTAQDVEKLNTFIAAIDVPFAHDVDLLIGSCANDHALVKFKGQSHFAALVAPESTLSKAKAGFIGELFVLYAESLQIGTCWLGLFNRNSVNKALYGNGGPSEPKKLHIAITLGRLPNEIEPIERKRKTVPENLSKDSLTDFPDTIRSALEYAAIAPSAMNIQSWFFKVSRVNEKYTVEISKPKNLINDKFVFADLNTGIAASHLYLALMNQGIACRVEVEEIGGNPVWKFAL